MSHKIIYERYFELILHLLDAYNKNEVSKEVVDWISKEDRQAAKNWAYREAKSRFY